MPNILIADSGSSKTDWSLIGTGKRPRHFKTPGLNPFFRSEDDCLQLLKDELGIKPEKEKIDKIYFYGAGIKGKPQAQFIEKILRKHFGVKQVHAYSDMLGAARATLGNGKGICAVLGTGSNSCYYNGKSIAVQNPSLGYIIGDEGSGTYLGKRVLQYYFYNTFDADLKDAFVAKYGTDLTPILQNVYQGPQGNRYLAAFTQFLIEQRGHYMVENIIEDGLIDFHQRHILKYREAWKYPIHFVGTVAWEFRDVLKDLHNQYGLDTGNIIKHPQAGLVAYHKAELV
ncbi:MAG: N-acetylglucosamine kinase [Edaphocola sp.]